MNADLLPDDHLTVPEAAKLLRVSSKTIVRWILAGKLRAWRIGRRYRVSRAELLEQAAPRVKVTLAGTPLPPTRRELEERDRDVYERLRRMGVV